MSVIGETRVLPEDLSRPRPAAADLRPLFETRLAPSAAHNRDCARLRHGDASSISRPSNVAFRAIDRAVRARGRRAAGGGHRRERRVSARRAFSAAAGHGLLGVTIPKTWGGLGLDYVSYALAIEAIARASATVAAVARRAQLARRRAPCARRARASRRSSGCAASPPATPSARLRCRSPTPAPTRRIRRRGPSKTPPATASPARRSGSPTPTRASVAIVFACTRPGLRGQGVTAFLVPMDTPGITRTARADSLGVRGLGCMDLDFDIEVTDDQVLGSGRSGIPAGDVGAAGRPRRHRRAGARHRRGGDRRGDRVREDAPRVRAADRQLPGDSVDAGRRGHRARSRADADAGRRPTPRIARSACALEASMAKLAASEAAHKAADRRCRFSRRPAIAADRWSSGCSATSARRRSIRGRPKRSGRIIAGALLAGA